LSADLVVDASGAGSRAPRWLEEIGYEAPEETVVDARLGYATRWYRVPEGFSGDWTGVAVLPGWPETTRGGTLRRVEGGLWTAVLIGTGGDYPPTDPEEFVAFAASLHSPAIHDAIKEPSPHRPSTATAAPRTACATTRGRACPETSSSPATRPASSTHHTARA
jgi:hypothetical protein